MLTTHFISVALVALSLFGTGTGGGEEIGGGGASWSIDGRGQAIDVSGNKTTPGAPAQPRPGHGNGATPIADIHFTPPPPKPTHPFDNRCVEWTSYDECLRLTPKDADPGDPADPATPATPSFSIADLASFAPVPATLTGEPDNLGVAGLPTNFTADAAVHTRNGTLFGYAIAARFTPASFTFHYGDTTTKVTKTSGESWEELDLPQFAPTDTSHTYTERGTYSARADTTYTAEIDLGTGWFAITGTLTIPGPAQDIRIYEAHTALVAHTCTENPTGPGC